MDIYYKKKIPLDKNIIKTNGITFQILDWWAKDESDDTEDSDTESESESEQQMFYSIYCFGKTLENQTVICKINNFYPYYYIKVKNERSIHSFITFIQKKLTKPFKNDLIVNKCETVFKKDLYGFRNDKNYTFVKLVFKNIKIMNKTKYFFKSPVIIENENKKPVKYKLYESAFDPFLRFCHLEDIQTANWINIKNFTQVNHHNTEADIYIQLNYQSKDKCIKKIENNTIANFLQASWDIEVYSFDGEFPDPRKKNKKGEEPNVIYQMATTYKYYNETKIIKHLLSLKKCNPIESTNENETIIVECFDTEYQLIKRWIDIIKKMNPDIIYTYNGDAFDWKYIEQRCSFLKLTDYLFNNISRLDNFKAEMKKEVFSSSAYGDSEFNRIYIPGRLNYDLLIHYKRGVKKYSSYKLDNIAYEILKERKEDVSVKQIFQYYEQGQPDKLAIIGKYCIQDTYLLQKLVDAQLILITIIQLANVTYVPISYLLSKGQTIKVTSQLLRKARQMNFLVPNTNFNEDTYPIQIKFKEPIDTNIFKIDDFIILESTDINKKNEDTKTNNYNHDKLNVKISEILDDTIIGLANIEISKIFYNVKLKYLGKEYTVSKVYSINDVLEDSFTGACVLSAQIGFHQDNVAVLDFASLYPTIIISRNLCYSTIVLDPSFDNIPHINYEKIEWKDQIDCKLNHTCNTILKSGTRQNQVCGKPAFFEVNDNYSCRTHDPLKKQRPQDQKYQKKNVDYSFKIVQTKNGAYKGVLPALLEELYAERKKVKKLMTKALEDGDKVYADILDKTQLGIKISLNSCYGFLGRKQGNMVLKELGSIVTAVGRTLIEQSKHFAENDFMQLIKTELLATHQIQTKNIQLSDHEKEMLLKKFQI